MGMGQLACASRLVWYCILLDQDARGSHRPPLANQLINHMELLVNQASQVLDNVES